MDMVADYHYYSDNSDLSGNIWRLLQQEMLTLRKTDQLK